MATETKKEIQFEIAHVLFIDIVGYSKLLIEEQRALLDTLNQIVRNTKQFKAAEASEKLIKIPTGDGMALVFQDRLDAPAECALEVSRALKEHPELPLRMGVHSGPVSGVIDVSGRANVTGAGVNVAQRIMDCGDAGHILVSKHVAEDLEQYARWKPQLHDLGQCEVKHGVALHVVNLYTDELGNPQLPQKFEGRKPKTIAPLVRFGEFLRSRRNVIVTGGLLLLALAATAVVMLSYRAIANQTLVDAAKVAGTFLFVLCLYAIVVTKGFRSKVPKWIIVAGAAALIFVLLCMAFVAGFPNNFPQPRNGLGLKVPAGEEKPLNLPALAQKARRAVVLIIAYDKASRSIKTGSGFFISDDGRLVTNWHVVDGVMNAQAKQENGAIYNIEGVLASSAALDLAVLKADARGVEVLSVDDADPPPPGTRIAVIGSPLAMQGSLSEGIVAATRDVNNGSWLQITAPISPGSSGSPVLERHGRVVGVATWIATEGQNLNFARLARDLSNFIRSIDENSKTRPLSDLALLKKDEILADPDFIVASEANKRGDGAKALKLLNELANRYPDDPRLLFQLACAYEGVGLHEEAYQSYREYVAINPTDPAGWHNFAIVAATLKKISEAINACTQTLKINPDASTWRMVGDLYGAQGDSAQQALAYAEAKKLEDAEKNRAADSAKASSPSPSVPSPATSAPVQNHSPDNRAVYIVVAPSTKQLNIRADHNAKAPIVTVLNDGDRVFLEQGHFLNTDPPHPTTWQEVTTLNGQRGWCDGDYLAPYGDAINSPRARAQQVRELFKEWLRISNTGDTVQEASLYSDPVDYLNFGTISRQQLVQELQQDLQRWPKQHNTTSKDPVIEELSESEWRVTFELTFDVRDPSKGKQITGTADLTWTVRKRDSGKIEITSSKEKVTGRKWHDIKRSGKPDLPKRKTAENEQPVGGLPATISFLNPETSTGLIRTGFSKVENGRHYNEFARPDESKVWVYDQGFDVEPDHLTIKPNEEP